ncbi:MAG: lipid-A-disaccharide synthase [Limnospira sp.]
MPATADILILSNGPGELTTWVRPVLDALRRNRADNLDIRISLILSPCPNATGQEVDIARSHLGIERVQGPEHFWPFLLRGKTAQNWDWRDRGLVIFLGGDQAFTPIVARRLGYQSLVYGEWDVRWWRWIDRFGVMKPEIAARVPKKYAAKCTVIGDLMADISPNIPETTGEELIALLPGSKAAKLVQGVPFTLAIARSLHRRRPQTRFVIPVAPTVDLATLARLADPRHNPLANRFGGISANLLQEGDRAVLQTEDGLQVSLHTRTPAHDLLSRCRFALTTIGANTAELGALGVPMIVLLPSYQLDAMRAWDGIPGLLANLPGVGTTLAKGINAVALWYLDCSHKLLAWPNIWAGEEIVPELRGKLKPEMVGDRVLEYLENPESLQKMRDRLREVRGEPGAAQKLAQIAIVMLSGRE